MYIFFYCVIILLILILLFLYSSFYKKENYNNYISFNTLHVKIPKIFYTEENNLIDINLNELSNSVTYLKHSEILEESTFSLINTFKFYIDKNKSNVVSITKTPNLCLFFINKKRVDLLLLDKNKSNDLDNIKEKLVIGYLDEYEKKLIEYIFYSSKNNLKEKNIVFLKMNISDIKNKLFFENTIDIFFYFNTYYHPIYDMIISNDYSIINYKTIEINLLKNFIPFCRQKNIILTKDIVNNKNENEINTNTILIDNLIYINESVSLEFEDEKRSIFELCQTNIINLYNNNILNSFYKTFFTFITEKEIENSKHILNNENFINSDKEKEENISLNLELDLEKNNIIIQDVPNLNPGISKTLYYKIFTIKDTNSIQFKKYDKLNVISNNKEYNGLFYIIDIDLDLEFTIISKYILLYNIDINDKIDLSKTTSSIDTIYPVKIETPLINNDIVYILSLNKEAIYINTDGNQTITPRFNIVNNQNQGFLEDTDFSNKYICFEDPSITEKEICERSIGKNGNTKEIYTWDRVCITNSECPFYLANKTYLNKRGGCKNGYCEFPLGIKRKSFRKYDKDTFPICKGCIGETPEECCKSQKNNPNYVFDDTTNLELLLHT